MFSGIVEEFATVVGIVHDRENVDFTLSCSFVGELGVDQSVAHDGVCLTVVRIVDGEGRDVPAGSPSARGYVVTAMRETLLRSTLGDWRVGTHVNVERSLLLNGRLDGHIVQGHVDCTAECVSVLDQDGSWTFGFRYAVDVALLRKGYVTVEKGSVTVNGVSLTVCNAGDGSFEVNIIPYTYAHTNFHAIEVGNRVNVEFDIIGKYLARLMPFAG